MGEGSVFEGAVYGVASWGRGGGCKVKVVGFVAEEYVGLEDDAVTVALGCEVAVLGVAG